MNSRGYIAISLSIIMSLVMMLVSIALGGANFSTRLTIADFNNKQASFAVARSCLNIALLRLSQSISYSGDDTMSISSYTCEIRPITTVLSNKVIEVSSQIEGATTNLRLTVVSNTLSTVSLEELQSF